MKYEYPPPSSDLNACRVEREYFTLASRSLKADNDTRQKRIDRAMIGETRDRLSKTMNLVQRILLEEMLEEIATIAGVQPDNHYKTPAARCPRARPEGVSYLRSYCEEWERQQDINDAIITFGRNINGYNPLFIDYLENCAVYDPDFCADDSVYTILSAVYGQNARETHLHPEGYSDIGCQACTFQDLTLLLEFKDDEAKANCLRDKERKRNDWLLSNIADC